MSIKPALLASSLAASFLLIQGCSRTEQTTGTTSNSGTGATGMATVSGGSELTGPINFNPSRPGGAPNWALGRPMGNGFRELNANQSGGMGTGTQGFNDVGAYGTSGTITDTHHTEPGMDESSGTSTSAH